MRFREGSIHGEITISDSGVIEGYVYNTERYMPVAAVDIYLDDTYIDSVLCNLKKICNINGKTEKINTGFIFKASKIMLKNANTLSLVLTNTGKVILKTEMKNLISNSDKITGVVHYDGGITLSGWAVNLKNPTKKLEITFLEDGKIIGKALADEPYAHSSNYFFHGFTFALPLKYLNGEVYQIRVLAENQDLDNSPITIKAQPNLFSEWLESVKNIDNTKKSLIVKHLQQVERICQRGIPFSLYPFWKDSFCKVSVKTNLFTKIKKINANDKKFDRAVKDALRTNKEHILIMFKEPKEDEIERLNYFLEEAVKGDADITYADGDLLFKPSFDPDLFLEYDYLGDFIVTKTSHLKKVLSTEKPPKNPIELRTLLILEALNNAKIAHVPIPLSTENQTSIDSVIEIRKETINSWAKSKKINLTVDNRAKEGLLRLRREPEDYPLISIIIPTKDKLFYLKKCIESINKKSQYKNIELILVDNNSEEKKTIEYLKALAKNGVKVIEYKDNFNFARIINTAVEQAKGEVLCLLNNDTELLSPDWIHTALELLAAPKVAIVGAKLLWPNEYVQHGGVVVGVSGLSYHVGNQWHKDEPGYMNRNLLTGRWSAVTAACMFIKKEIFLSLGGMNPLAFPVNFNDTDFCLRAVMKGYDVVFSPDIRLIHHESISRGKDQIIWHRFRAQREIEEFRDRWGNYDDPYYNPNLALSNFQPPFSGLALPNRPRRTRIWSRN